jgi:hypothetical protein
MEAQAVPVQNCDFKSNGLDFFGWQRGNVNEFIGQLAAYEEILNGACGMYYSTNMDSLPSCFCRSTYQLKDVTKPKRSGHWQAWRGVGRVLNLCIWRWLGFLSHKRYQNPSPSNFSAAFSCQAKEEVRRRAGCKNLFDANHQMTRVTSLCFFGSS